MTNPSEMAADGLDLSVVIPTFNRPQSLRRLLEHLALQSLAPHRFEVIAVADGAQPWPADPIPALPYALTLETQAHQGPAAARHRGALLARGRLLLFVDDDMQLPRELLERHLAAHARSPAASVVLGQIRPDRNIASMPLFERYHARMLEAFAQAVREQRHAPGGPDVCTGNVSIRRDDYLAVGGFDPAFDRSEDAELGVRLGKAGLRFHFAEDAFVHHGSDHTQLDVWLGRAFRYGINDLRMSRKHPDVPHANPFRFLREVHPLSRPLLAGALVAPAGARLLAKLAMAVAQAADRAGLKSTAIQGATFVYGLEYFRGVREEEGTGLRALRDACAHLLGGTELARLWSEVVADHAAIRRYEAKYHQRTIPAEQLGRDLVEKIGFQMMAVYRVMRACRRAGQLGAAKAISRLLRHLYGADIHWEADFAPGVLIVHGMGMAVARDARVGPGVILNHHVTIGESIDPLSGQVGAPRLEADVHVGPGAVLLGPITLGEGSKVMPGAVVTRSVPPRSLVSVPEAAVAPRSGRPRKPLPAGRASLES